MLFACIAAANLASLFPNIELAKSDGRGFSPCEPTIAISHRNPDDIAAGCVLDRAMATHDGGRTWETQRLRSKWGVFGDPALASDSQGNFYYIHLTNRPGAYLDRVLCQKSSDGGNSWADGDGFGIRTPTNQDKAWPAVHPSKPTIAVTWTRFDHYGSKDPHDESNIVFSISRDAGKSWSEAKRINEISGECLDDSGTTEGAVPAIDGAGRIGVAWSNHDVIWFQRSADGGANWLKHDIPVTRQIGGWDMTIPGLDRSNGMPVLMADNSRGPYSGSLYILFADKRNGADDCDIWLTRSRDHGDTWSKPLRVNRDGKGKQQFLPWLSVDPTTGYLYAVYYDRRAHADLQTDVYLACSTDGGRSFREVKISEAPFTPDDKHFFGDYNNISAFNGVIAPIWTRMDDGKTSVWTAIVHQKSLLQHLEEHP